MIRTIYINDVGFLMGIHSSFGIESHFGWDCHGLPIEQKALLKYNEVERDQLNPMDVRKAFYACYFSLFVDSKKFCFEDSQQARQRNADVGIAL